MISYNHLPSLWRTRGKSDNSKAVFPFPPNNLWRSLHLLVFALTKVRLQDSMSHIKILRYQALYAIHFSRLLHLSMLYLLPQATFQRHPEEQKKNHNIWFKCFITSSSADTHYRHCSLAFSTLTQNKAGLWHRNGKHMPNAPRF